MEIASLLWPGNCPSINPASFYWSRQLWSSARSRGFSWIHRFHLSMGTEAKDMWPSLVCPSPQSSSPNGHLLGFSWLRPQLKCHSFPDHVDSQGSTMPTPPSPAARLPFTFFDCPHSSCHHLKLICLFLFPPWNLSSMQAGTVLFTIFSNDLAHSRH